MSTLDPQPNPWSALKVHTDARVALGRTGTAPPLKSVLDFKLAHAKARDAVHTAFELGRIQDEVQHLGLETLELYSSASTRAEFLTRPDLGRQLSAESRKLLKSRNPKPCDLVLVIGEGLSARAIHENVLPFLRQFHPQLATNKLQLAPLCLVHNARVAIADEIGEILNAKTSIILIGERPGLSSPNSMGLYLTRDPKTGNTDETRNCISNIRPGGLDYEHAARKACYLLQESLRLGYSGVQLKDTMPEGQLSSHSTDSTRLA